MSQQTPPLPPTNDEIIVGLDIGTTKICAIVGRRNEHKKLEILGVGKADSQGVLRGDIVNIDLTISSIKSAIKQAEYNSKVLIREVYVGIAGQHIKSIKSRGSKIRSGEELERSINSDDIHAMVQEMYNIAIAPGEEILHILPLDFTVDSIQGIKNPEGMMGNRIEATFHIILGQTSAIRNIKNCVEKAGIVPKKLILEPLASAASVLTEEEKKEGVVLIDIGGGTTDIAIFYDDIIRHTHVIPAGGNVITEDIRSICKIMERQAELLKVNHGSALSTENVDDVIITIPGLQGRNPREISQLNLAKIIQTRMEEILEVVYSEVINSNFKNNMIGGLVITGGGSKLNHLKQLASYTLCMDATIGVPSVHLNTVNNDTLQHPMYATAVGLVLKGFEDLDARKLRGEFNEPIKKKAGWGFSILENIGKLFIDKKNEIDKDE